MQHYRKTSHSTYDIKFRSVWITKYRKKVLQRGIRFKDSSSADYIAK